MKERWKRGGNWSASARPMGQYPNVYVEVPKDGSIKLSIFKEKGTGIGLTLDRRLARMTARRIMQCLEATK